MKKRLSIILCLALILCLIPTTSAFAAKKVKAKSVSVAPKEMTLAVGDVVQLKATKKPSKSTDKLTWTSSDKSVATVSKGGLVQAVSSGTAVITVKTTSKKKAKCTVTVKEYADKDEISTSISQNTYTKSELDKKFAEIPAGASCDCAADIEAMKTKISEIAEKAYTTKDDVESLISEKTYTKDEIDSKINAISPENESSSDGGAGFKDGDEVQLYSGQSMPYSFKSDDGTEIKINSISIKKYHYDQVVDDVYSPYKYELTIKGVVPDLTNGKILELHLTFMSKDGESSASYYYPLKTYDYGNVNMSYSESGKEFTLTANQFWMDNNYSSFYIRGSYTINEDD